MSLSEFSINLGVFRWPYTHRPWSTGLAVEKLKRWSLVDWLQSTLLVLVISFQVFPYSVDKRTNHSIHASTCSLLVISCTCCTWYKISQSKDKIRPKHNSHLPVPGPITVFFRILVTCKTYSRYHSRRLEKLRSWEESSYLGRKKAAWSWYMSLKAKIRGHVSLSFDFECLQAERQTYWGSLFFLDI